MRRAALGSPESLRGAEEGELGCRTGRPGAGLQCPKALGWSGASWGGGWKGQVSGEGTRAAGALSKGTRGPPKGSQVGRRSSWAALPTQAPAHPAPGVFPRDRVEGGVQGLLEKYWPGGC